MKNIFKLLFLSLFLFSCTNVNFQTVKTDISLLKKEEIVKLPIINDEIEKRYNEEFEIKVYFIITELVNNILKHSKATSGYITLEEKNNQIIINVEDNGKGFDSSKTYSSDGFGLTQIKARVKNLKGKITINSKMNAGTLVYIKLHIPH